MSQSRSPVTRTAAYGYGRSRRPTQEAGRPDAYDRRNGGEDPAVGQHGDWAGPQRELKLIPAIRSPRSPSPANSRFQHPLWLSQRPCPLLRSHRASWDIFGCRSKALFSNPRRSRSPVMRTRRHAPRADGLQGRCGRPKSINPRMLAVSEAGSLYATRPAKSSAPTSAARQRLPFPEFTSSPKRR